MVNWLTERSERVENTNQLRQMAITESTTDLVAMLDADGFIIHLNKAGYQLLELDDSEDITRIRMASMYSARSAAAFKEGDIPRAIMSGASHSELQVISINGRLIPASQVLIAHNDSDGSLSHFSVILRDISEIKEAEIERQKLIKQLHQSRKLETLGRLAGGVAHDFNNLMTLVMGYAELGILNADEGKTSRSELDVILDTAHKAARLSNQLLDFSRRQTIEPQLLDLNEILLNSKTLIESIMGAGINIHLETQDFIWPIKIDRSQLEQIILNLTINARDALNAHGTYSLSTENYVHSSKISTNSNLSKDGEYVRLLITDTGCGIEQDIIEQIFDPFFTTKEKGKGTGLGLSAVYGSVKQNMGSITVTSKPGKGTSFEILFPRAYQEKVIIDVESQDNDNLESNSGSEKILLVEDNCEVRTLLSRILASLGYKVLEAENGVDALETLKQESECDLVVTDIIMPEMNGIELFREMKKIASPVKLMFMSGHTDELISPQELIDSNITLLKKPFPSNKFTKTIREILDTPAANSPYISV